MTTFLELLPMWMLFEGSIWLAVLFERRRAKVGSGLGYSGRLMARAAVKAKQQAKAKAQPAKARAARAAAAQRRRQPEPGALLRPAAAPPEVGVRACSRSSSRLGFVGVGVGSGNGGGLQQLYTGLFGGSGGSSVSKAQDEIKKDPAKGYRDLATAYEQKGDTAQAITALKSYLALKKKDADAWGELGGLELSQGNTYATQYQQAQQAAQAADPSAPFLPGGTLGSAVGQNPAYAGRVAAGGEPDVDALPAGDGRVRGSAVTDYQKASKLQPAQHDVPPAARDGRGRTPATATVAVAGAAAAI